MAQQVIHRGPDADRTPADVIDRTQILAPGDIWPNPLDCPDWPSVAPHQRYEGPRGKAAAEARLELIGQLLNRGPGTLRSPTSDERDAEFARTFRRSGSNWHHLGIRELSPLGMMVEGDAELIVEACHLRGYLRKLEAQDAQAAGAKERDDLARARRTLDSFKQSLAAGRAELTELAEAEARHKQRLEDERAFARCNEIRSALRHDHHPAVQAATALSVELPPLPTFFD